MKGVVLLMLGLGCCGVIDAGEVDRALIVSTHNKWRSQVGVADLTYSLELEVSAQAWADHLKTANRCRMRHSKPEGRYGENLYWASALIWSDGRRELQQVASSKPVDSWGGEIQDYSYANNSCRAGKMCGHYTQMVWRESTHVGCALAVCEDTREQIWVCQYQPAGNVVGSRPY
jgi:pathogenesis-related protein 1